MKRNKTPRVSTEAFEIGRRVRINCPGSVCHDMEGEISDNDGYVIEVRIEKITEPMRHYEDSRKGLISYEPQHLILL